MVKLTPCCVRLRLAPMTQDCIICPSKPKGVTYVDTKEVCFLQCPQCSLVWRTRPEGEMTHYEEAEYFARIGYDDRRAHRVSKSQKQLQVIERYPLPAKRSLLEIGCSKGYFLEAAKKRNWEVTGIDISGHAAEHCRKLGFDAHTMDARDIHKLGRRFGVIVMKHVFEHFNDPIGYLKILHAQLEDKGLIFIDIPHQGYIKAVLLKEKYKYYNAKHVATQHYFYYLPDNLAAMVEQHGFRVLMKCDPWNSLLGAFRLTKTFWLIAQKI